MGAQGSLLLPEFSKCALDTPPLHGELLKVGTASCLLLNPWCPALCLAQHAQMGVQEISCPPGLRAWSQVDLSSLFQHHLTLFFCRGSHFSLLKTLFLSYNGLSLLWSIVPYGKSSLCNQAFLDSNLDSGNCELSYLDELLTSPGHQFPLSTNEAIIHSIHLFTLGRLRHGGTCSRPQRYIYVNKTNIALA